jgi:uncharacterized protein with ParB-like and HNH nuclease domain
MENISCILFHTPEVSYWIGDFKMAQFQDLSIKSVVEEINKSFFIPDIQREYVWLRNPDERKIEQLFDSLLRGYPISSFLIWKLKKTDIEFDKINQNDNEKLNIQFYWNCGS